MSSSVTFVKFAGTPDPNGDREFEQKLGGKGVALRDVSLESALPWGDLAVEDRAFITLMRIPRRFNEVSNCGAVPNARAVQLLRALHAAELLDTVDEAKTRALIPVELRRALADQTGQTLVRKKLVAQIYRPGVEPDAPATLVSVPKSTTRPAHASAPSSAPSAAPAAPSAAPAAPSAAPAAPSAAPAAPSAAPAAPASSSAVAPAAAKPELATPTADYDAVEREVFSAYARARNADHFAVLGVERSVTDDKVKSAYLGLVRKWHPDRLSGVAGPRIDEVRKRMEHLFNAVSEAHRVLGEKGSRGAYLEDLKKREASKASGTGTKPTTPPVRAEEARMHGQMGRVFAKKGEWPTAQKEYKMAMTLDVGLLEYKVEYAWAFMMNVDNGPEAERRKSVLHMLDDTIRGTTYADGFFKLGLIHRMAGDQTAAELAFKKALSLDPKHVDAGKEVRLLDLREDKAKRAVEENAEPAKPLSFLDKLRGKKD